VLLLLLPVDMLGELVLLLLLLLAAGALSAAAGSIAGNNWQMEKAFRLCITVLHVTSVLATLLPIACATFRHDSCSATSGAICTAIGCFLLTSSAYCAACFGMLHSEIAAVGCALEGSLSQRQRHR
jgi:hypothetical protein